MTHITDALVDRLLMQGEGGVGGVGVEMGVVEVDGRDDDDG